MWIIVSIVISILVLFYFYSKEGSAPPVEGCMDATAFNYDPDANIAAECIPKVEGCVDDATAFNYNPDANTEAVCIPVVKGCMDATALNYDATANTEAECIAPPIQDGLMGHHSWYSFDPKDETMWRDLSGNGNHALRRDKGDHKRHPRDKEGSVRFVPQGNVDLRGFGEYGPWPYVSGNRDSKWDLFGGEVSSVQFTIVFIMRYDPEPSDLYYGNILNGSHSNHVFSSLGGWPKSNQPPCHLKNAGRNKTEWIIGMEGPGWSTNRGTFQDTWLDNLNTRQCDYRKVGHRININNVHPGKTHHTADYNIAEMLYYNRTLTADEIQQTKAWLNNYVAGKVHPHYALATRTTNKRLIEDAMHAAERVLTTYSNTQRDLTVFDKTEPHLRPGFKEKVDDVINALGFNIDDAVQTLLRDRVVSKRPLSSIILDVQDLVFRKGISRLHKLTERDYIPTHLPADQLTGGGLLNGLLLNAIESRSIEGLASALETARRAGMENLAEVEAHLRHLRLEETARSYATLLNAIQSRSIETLPTLLEAAKNAGMENLGGVEDLLQMLRLRRLTKNALDESIQKIRTLTPPVVYTHCANENEHCDCEGGSVRFGAGTKWASLFGLDWKNVGTAKPTGGRELTSAKLASYLDGRTIREFNPELLLTSEFKYHDFPVAADELQPTDYIKSGNSYYQPVMPEYSRGPRGTRPKNELNNIHCTNQVFRTWNRREWTFEKTCQCGRAPAQWRIDLSQDGRLFDFMFAAIESEDINNLETLLQAAKNSNINLEGVEAHLQVLRTRATIRSCENLLNAIDSNSIEKLAQFIETAEEVSIKIIGDAGDYLQILRLREEFDANFLRSLFRQAGTYDG